MYDGFFIVGIFLSVETPRSVRSTGNRIDSLLSVKYPITPQPPINRNADPVSPRHAIPRLMPYGRLLIMNARQITPSGTSISITMRWNKYTVGEPEVLEVVSISTRSKMSIAMNRDKCLCNRSIPPWLMSRLPRQRILFHCRRTHEAHCSRTSMAKDADVDTHGRSLAQRRVLLLVTGGIAAVESVRLSRELRRHGATLSIMMTREAEKIITPLALSWASGTEALTGWEHEMAQLDDYDAVLVAPATRNTISKHIHGVMDSPVTMALSAARGNQTPTLFVPSMHSDLFDDPVTEDLIDRLRDEGSAVLNADIEEGRRKQPDAVTIVAELCYLVNSQMPDRKVVAITLGANRAPIDSVRAIQNASSGSTGWTIAQHLHRMGHTVICIAGKTSVQPDFGLPDVRRAGSPDDMLAASLELASSDTRPDAWIHSAAVLDYFAEPLSGKKASGDEDWDISLAPGPKHIAELAPLVEGSRRIGFKLETEVPIEVLIDRARNQIERYGVDAVVANLKEEVHDPDSPRGRIVLPDGSVRELVDDIELCETIESLLHG